MSISSKAGILVHTYNVSLTYLCISRYLQLDTLMIKKLENSCVIIVVGLSSGTGDFNVSSKRCNTSYDWIELQKKAAVIGDKESVTSGQYL